jgi:hypothetical protein
MIMRKIAVIGLMVLTVAAVGCSKKTEERANENMSAPPAQQAAPESAPMQGMDMSKPAEPAPGEAPAQTQDGQAPACGK